MTNNENIRSPEDDGKILIQAVYLNNHTYTIMHYTEKGLSLHLVVDDNCKRLADLEQEVIKLRIAGECRIFPCTLQPCTCV